MIIYAKCDILKLLPKFGAKVFIDGTFNIVGDMQLTTLAVRYNHTGKEIVCLLPKFS
jgi:hypothetical protein